MRLCDQRSDDSGMRAFIDTPRVLLGWDCGTRFPATSLATLLAAPLVLKTGLNAPNALRSIVVFDRRRWEGQIRSRG